MTALKGDRMLAVVASGQQGKRHTDSAAEKHLKPSTTKRTSMGERENAQQLDWKSVFLKK